jgi:hypothetical protein
MQRAWCRAALAFRVAPPKSSRCSKHERLSCDGFRRSFTKFRDTIYDILVYNLDVPECLWYVISYFIQRNIFTEDEIENVMNKMYIFLKQYNNNYRPIYHLESIFFYIINIIQSKNA